MANADMNVKVTVRRPQLVLLVWLLRPILWLWPKRRDWLVVKILGVQVDCPGKRKQQKRVSVNLKAHLKYLRYVVLHKFYVFQAGRRFGVGFWQLLIHDLSKFTPSEWFPYVAYFYGDKIECCLNCNTPKLPPAGVYVPGPGYIGFPRCPNPKCTLYDVRAASPISSKWVTPESVKEAFNRAWLKHIQRNPHHWNAWLLMNDNPSGDWTLWQMTPPFGSFTLAYKNEPVGELFNDEHPLEENARYLLAGEVCKTLNRTVVPLEMPEEYVREMLADWWGAGQAQLKIGSIEKNDLGDWYLKNKDKHIFHPATRALVEQLLREYGYLSKGE